MRTARYKRNYGATTVEMAIVLPVIFLITMASIELTRGSILRHVVDNAAYEACRNVIVPGATTAEANAAAAKVLSPFGINSFSVTVTPSPILETTTQVTCRVTAPVAANMWGAPKFLVGTNFVGQSTLIAERTPAMQATITSQP